MRWSRALNVALAVGWMALLAAAGNAQTKTPLVHKTKYAMGTVYEIAAYDESPARASAAIDRAFAEVVYLDGVLSNYKPESDLSRLNREGHFHAVKVPPDLYRVIEESLKYSRISGGEFDISVGPLVDLWKAALRGDRVPTAEEQAKARACVGYEKIKLIPPDQVEFESPCLRIDVGSIGKGYAVDRAVDILRAEGIQNALVDAGQSSIYGMGAPPGRKAWEVHLRDPSGHVDPVVMLSENSVSTSEQTPPSLLGNQTAGHIIDPKNGKPLVTNYALSVVVKTGTASDALSTTLLLVGPEKGRAIVKELPEAAAIWVAADGTAETASTGPEILLTTRDSRQGTTLAGTKE
ncbi:MAG TPA: FAD:protein FMN transferase [Candidatus Saccharimonadales bacterium]|nr:FAD:protein FMN transferase [Candidatus Saccharimonadales bacterium]